MSVLYIDKPKGITSFKLCNKLKKALNVKKIGHTGTLDPNATGLMIVLTNQSTKVNQFLVTDKKEYIATCKLGILTDTLDIDGEILLHKELKMPSKQELDEAFSMFIGEYSQIPPMTSAIKVNGKKLYDYMRAGIEVEVKARKVNIYELELLSLSNDEFRFRCLVSSGTYVRSLLKDILDKLDLIGTLKDLRRTRINDVSIYQADSFDDALNGNYKEYSLYDVLKDRYYTYVIDDTKYIKEGKTLKLDLNYNEILLVDKNNNCLAIYRKENDVYKCVRGLF